MRGTEAPVNRLFLISVRTAAAAVSLALVACNKPTPPAEEAPAAKTAPVAPAAKSGTTITDANRTEAKEIFASRCTPCHGQTGGGDGAASAGLTPKPRNFHDPEWQKTTTDEHIEKIIKFGGAAVGKAPMMPANPDLADKDAVVAALREHIRSLADK
jgi:mono/diheme cytochrome c family protein